MNTTTIALLSLNGLASDGRSPPPAAALRGILAARLWECFDSFTATTLVLEAATQAEAVAACHAERGTTGVTAHWVAALLGQVSCSFWTMEHGSAHGVAHEDAGRMVVDVYGRGGAERTGELRRDVARAFHLDLDAVREESRDTGSDGVTRWTFTTGV